MLTSDKLTLSKVVYPPILPGHLQYLHLQLGFKRDIVGDNKVLIA